MCLFVRMKPSLSMKKPEPTPLEDCTRMVAFLALSTAFRGGKFRVSCS
jgi:hypothetical protein